MCVAEGVVRNLMLNVGMFVWVCAAHAGRIPPVVSCAGGVTCSDITGPGGDCHTGSSCSEYHRPAINSMLLSVGK